MKNFFLFLCIFGIGSVHAAAHFAEAKKLITPSPVTPKVDQVSVVSKQLEMLEQTNKKMSEKLDEYQRSLDKKSSDLLQVKNRLKNETSQKGFYSKKLSLISSTYQSIAENIQAMRQMLTLLEEHITELKSYQADPNFEALLLPKKASFDFEDLKKSAQSLFAAKTRLDELENLKKNTEYDYERRKRALDAIIKEYDACRQRQQGFSQDIIDVDSALINFTKKQQGELIDEQLEEADYKKQLAELKVEEDKIRLELLDTRILIKKRQIDVLQKEYATLKRSVVIDSYHVKSAEAELEKKRQEFLEKRERFNDNIRLLLPVKEQYKKEFDRMVQRYDIPVHDIAAIKEWRRDSDQLKIIQEWLIVAYLGVASVREALVDTQLELLDAQIRQAHLKFEHEELEVKIVRSWYHMTHPHSRFHVDEELEQEVKKYETERSQLKVDLAEISEKRDAVINLLYRLNVVRDKIKVLVSALGEQHRILFASHNKEYQEVLNDFVAADEEVRKRINFIGLLMEAYAKSIAIIRDSIKDIEDIVHELGGKGFWMRSDTSIEWKDLRNFIPDLKRFLRDVRATGLDSIKNFSLACVFERIWNYVQSPYSVILLFLRLLIAIVIFFLLRMYLPDLYLYVLQGESRYRFFARMRGFVAAFLEYAIQHLAAIYGWLLLFSFVHAGFFTNYFSLWFYLFSIPYLLLLAYGFFQHVMQVNRNRSYLLISQDYQWRFIAVLSTLVYATIIISFFRQAFMAVNYFDSSMPDILLALNFILFQIALICLIGKEQILGLFAARRTPASEWLEERIEKYYYFVLIFLIAVIVMSNPYVGYGRQVFYVLSRIFITGCLIPVFSWLHNRIKRASADFFFYYTDGTAVKERFPAGKSWYGIFIVFSFMVFVIFGIVIGARLWGMYVSFDDIKHWFTYTIYSPGLDEVTGKPIQVTGLSLIKIMFYVLGGFVFAYIVNRYVLRRIFDPLLIGSGIQSTILTLTRYVAVIVALLIGLHSAGLEGMAMKLVVLIGLLSFALKEPLSDFFAYFIILVQRPVKIGDLIQIDPDIIGIVRHITPRSTIVRHRNSVTLVIPNSMIITRMVRNWSYMRTFSAINDIEITLPFNTDIDRAKQIMFEVLDSNHNILKNPAPIVWLTDFADHGYRFLIRGFLSMEKVTERFEIESQIRFELVRRLRQAGMKIAIPVRLIQQVQEKEETK
jgi:small-conductance mechanosensitive channel